MGVSSYFEFVTVLFGWIVYDRLWAVLNDTGIVYLPFFVILLKNLSGVPSRGRRRGLGRHPVAEEERDRHRRGDRRHVPRGGAVHRGAPRRDELRAPDARLRRGAAHRARRGARRGERPRHRHGLRRAARDDLGRGRTHPDLVGLRARRLQGGGGGGHRRDPLHGGRGAPHHDARQRHGRGSPAPARARGFHHGLPAARDRPHAPGRRRRRDLRRAQPDGLRGLRLLPRHPRLLQPALLAPRAPGVPAESRAGLGARRVAPHLPGVVARRSERAARAPARGDRHADARRDGLRPERDSPGGKPGDVRRRTRGPAAAPLPRAPLRGPDRRLVGELRTGRRGELQDGSLRPPRRARRRHPRHRGRRRRRAVDGRGGARHAAAGARQHRGRGWRSARACRSSWRCS